MSRPSGNGVGNRYALTDRERRRRHWWWVLALLLAIVVGLVTFALARNRDDGRPTTLGRTAVTNVGAPWPL